MSRISAKTMLAALLAGALMVAQAAPPAFAQATEKAKSEKPDKKSTKAGDEKAETKAKTLTPQQQKMKDCGAKWQAEKKAKGVSGKEAYQKFLRTCLKT